MANYQLGSAFISVFPQMKGFRKTVARDMSAAGREGGSRLSKTLDKLGVSAGAGLGSRLRTAFGKASTGLGSTVTDQLASQAKKAESALSKALNKAADDQGKVRIATAQLAEARDKYGEGTSQVIRAEERLAAAERKAAESLAFADAKARQAGEAQGALRRASQTTATTVSSVFKTIGSSVTATLGKIPGIGSAFTKATGTISTGFGTVSGKITSFASNMKETVGKAFASLPGPVQKAVSGIGSAFSGVRTTIGNVAGGLAGAVSGGLSALSGAFSATFKSIASAAGAAGMAIAGGIVSHLGQAATRVDTLNNFPKVMQNLGYSAEDASASISSIVGYFDNGLPGSLDQMASSVQKFAPIMQGMGKDLGETTRFTTALNDALLAGGKGTEGAARGMEQYSQMLATGKVDLQSWKIMQEVMPGQLNQLAKALLGPTANMSTLYASLQSGETSLEDFNDAIVKLDEEGGDGFASFAQQAQDATGGIMTAVGKIGTGFTKAGASIIEAIGPELITSVATKIKTIVETVGTGLGGLIEKIKGFASGGGSAFSGLLPVIGGLAGAFAGLASRLPLIGGAFRFLGGPVGLIIGLFAAMWTKSEALRDAVGGLASTLGSTLSATFTALQPALAAVANAIGLVATSLGDALAAALDAIAPVLPVLANSLATIGATLAGTLAQALAAIAPLLPTIGQLVGTIAASLGGVLASAIQMVATAIQAFLPALIQIVQGVLPIVQQALAAIMPLIPAIASAISAVMGAVQAILPPLMQVLQAVLPPLIAAIKAVVPPIVSIVTTVLGRFLPVLSQIITWLGKVIATVVSFAANLVSKIMSAITRVISFFTNFRANVSSAMSAVKNTVSNAINGVLGFFRSLPGKIKGALAGAGSWLVSVGRDMVNGLLNGIGNFASKVFGKLKSGISSAIGSVKSFLGIGSPSRLIAAQIGEPIAQGVALGVDKATPAMIRDVSDDLNRVSEIRVAAPVNWAARAVYAAARSGPGTALAGRVVNNTINVQAVDPASVAQVIEARTRLDLGA